MKRVLALALTVVLCLGLLPSAQAIPPERPRYYTVTETLVNPLYPEFQDEAVPAVVTPVESSYQPDAGGKKYVSVEEGARQLRAAMEKHQEVVHLYVESPDSIGVATLFNQIVNHTGVPTQGDYILWSYKSFRSNISVDYRETSSGYTNLHDMKITITYYHNAEQEQELTQKIDEVLTSLQLDKYPDDYHKLRAIYEYLASHIDYRISYDEEDPYYLMQYSAYHALVKGEAVCLGISTLLYRMLLEAGFDNRIITGHAYLGRHAWNIVKVGDLYYNVDLTNDLDRVFRYLLCSQESFKGYHRDSQYDTPQFHQLYPMSEEDYQPVHYFDGQPWVTSQEPDCTRPGVQDQYCRYCSHYKTRYSASALGHSWEHVGFQQATCTESGGRVYSCTRCGRTGLQRERFPLGHDFDVTVLREPTPTDRGLVHRYCILCGKEYQEAAYYQLHDHLYSETVRVDPTCTHRGYTAAVCGSIEDCIAEYRYDYVEPLGHSWEGERCRNCLEFRLMPFDDVPVNAFFYAPVFWAIDHNVTNGTSANSFSPYAACQRAQVVTFLWRAAGCPEPISTENPFVDVKEDDYYYKAVLWALENGITNGIDSTHFGPFEVCNRAQVVTFLHRSLGEPGAYGVIHTFTDVDPTEFYYSAMLWAVEERVTRGLTNDTFGPNVHCNRAQIVTFLHRASY